MSALCRVQPCSDHQDVETAKISLHGKVRSLQPLAFTDWNGIFMRHPVRSKSFVVTVTHAFELVC